MKIVFIAALEEGYECVKAVHKGGWKIDAIFTLDNSHSNRSAYKSFSDIESLASNFYYVSDITKPKNIARLERLKPDLIVLLGWSFIIPNEIIRIPKLGAIATHPTLLPKGRGAAPIPWSIILGVKNSGISWFYLTEEIDAGDILIQKEYKIEFSDGAREVYDKVVKSTVEGILEILPKIKDNNIKITKPDFTSSSYLPRRKPEDGLIDWNKMSVFLYKWIKGLSSPYPGSFTFCNGRKYLIWDCEIFVDNTDREVVPGLVQSVDETGILVSTGDGSLLITDIGMSGKNVVGIKPSTLKIRAGDQFK